MLTTAGAARATESAKLGIAAPECAGAAAAGCAAASCAAAGCAAGELTAPSKAGFHQTTRKAAARPTTTALSKKLARTRAFCTPTPYAAQSGLRIRV